jgi:uncharacterized protein HemY
MATLAIRDDLLTRIAKLAEASSVSVDVQAERLLLDSIQRSEASANVLRRLRAIAAMTPKGIQQTDSVFLLRQDRDR